MPQISIHAPLTGSDATIESNLLFSLYFNPRSPHRERQRDRKHRKQTSKFQSTLPSQGATYDWGVNVPYGAISIHAPLTGSDIYESLLNIVPLHFNPRSPHRERLYDSNLSVAQILISIHAPLTGSDGKQFNQFATVAISIHAPLTGSD